MQVGSNYTTADTSNGSNSRELPSGIVPPHIQIKQEQEGARYIDHALVLILATL